MMMKEILLFSQIQSLLFRPRLDAPFCPQGTRTASLASTVTTRKEYYFIGFQVMLALGVMKKQTLLQKLVF